MAKGGRGSKRIVSVVGMVVELALALAAMPVLSAAAAPVNAETGIGQKDMFVAAPPAGKVEGFDVPEHRAVPGFELVEEAAAPWPASASLDPGAVAGRYAVLREGGKDTGCMLTLKEAGKGRGGTVLSPACRGQGIVIFNSAFWQIIEDRLMLTAPQGRKIHFDREADDGWKEDPNEGKVLILKRM